MPAIVLTIVLAIALAACGAPGTTTAAGDGPTTSASADAGRDEPRATASPTPAPTTTTTGLSPASSGPLPPGGSLGGGPTRPADAAGPYAVVEVVDGDTVKVARDGATVTLRLIGMDTPETRDPRKPVQCFGREASAKAKELLTGASVWLTSDPTQGELDKYDRTLAYLWLPDGRLFSWLMIAEGYAHEYTYSLPYRYQDEHRAAERSAREAGRGLWSPTTCNGDTVQPADGPTTTAAAPASPAPVPVPVPPPTTTATATGGGCDPNYAGACIPPFPPDLDCGQIAATRFRSVGSDPHRLDGDKDGIACE